MEYYNKNYFDWQKESSNFGSFYTAQFFRPYIKHSDTILDIGCGGGFLLNTLNAGSKFGIEINDTAIEFAKDQHNLDVRKDFDSFNDSFFDVIISNHALEHIPSPIDILKNAYAKLKDNGTLVIIVPYPFEQARIKCLGQLI